MPHEVGNFQTTGPTWQERAEKVPGIAAVYAPNNPQLSQWLNVLFDCPFRVALSYSGPQSTVLDFGCGIGTRTLALAQRTRKVIGVEITPGMLKRAFTLCQNSPVILSLIDGIHIPLASNSIDLIWICGVLRYSLFGHDPKHEDIVREFFRILKPGGMVCNLEMYVDQPSDIFSSDFKEIGFILKQKSVAHLYNSIFDRYALRKWKRLFLKPWWATLCYQWTRRTSVEERLDNRLRDYFFTYQKP